MTEARHVPVEKGGSDRTRNLLFPVMGVLLLFLMILAASVGAVTVPFSEVGEAIWNGLQGTDGDWTTNGRIIFFVRLPRVLLAALVGGVLGISGAVMQGIFRNPMADPGVLGVSSGAGLGAVAAISFGLVSVHMLLLPLFAFLGAITASALIFLLAGRGGRRPATSLILSGMAISMLFGALTTAILMFIHSDQVKQFLFWTTGSLNSTNWESLNISALPMLICSLLLLLFRRDLNVMSLGEEQSKAVGMNPERARTWMLILTSGATAAAVSVSGTIGFVGLMVPHMLRILFGPDHRRLLPASMLGGAILLVGCDLIGRTLFAPKEIGVGIVTAILGAPYLLFLLSRQTGREGGGI